ncbi:hypothetical protein [Hydrogenimonas sp.]
MNPDPNTQAIISKLKEENLSYAVITGTFEEAGTLHEQKTKNLQSDLDIVFFDISRTWLHEKLLNLGLKHIEFNTYTYAAEDGSTLPIDIYIDYINTGYYLLFPIQRENIQEYNGYNIISENDYILYQTLEPLIKFSGYKKRHWYRLKRYMDEGYFTSDIKERLCSIIGYVLATYLIDTISKKDHVDKKIVQLIKLRLLFKHGNFLRMVKQRILNNG